MVLVLASKSWYMLEEHVGVGQGGAGDGWVMSVCKKVPKVCPVHAPDLCDLQLALACSCRLVN